MDVNMRVDETGKDQLPAGVDDFGPLGHFKIPADSGDVLTLTVDVGLVSGFCGDDFAVLYQ